ncbi:MAG: phenylalanine--tRNA ligase beta subunit-related protein [Kiloniellales bacterium]
MAALDISDVLPDFPDYRVALVVAQGLEIAPERGPELAQAVAEVEAEVAAFLGEKPLNEVPELQVWRAAYKAMGVKKTSYRSSVERLLKQIQQGRGLPRVNALVDSYNAVSARHRLPVGADDLDKVTGDLAFRRAREGDDFYALGAEPPVNDPPKTREVVYADGEKLLCRRWNWYQDGRSATSLETRRALLTVQWLGGGTGLEPAVEELCAWLSDHCAARCAWAIAEAATPRAEVGLD